MDYIQGNQSRFKGNKKHLEKIYESIFENNSSIWNEFSKHNSINLIGANLRKAILGDINLSKAYLNCANLNGADLSGADLTKANLSETNLSEANLSGADLSGADLSGADLSEANLSEANLSGADLSGADLNGADLFQANLTGADLTGADLNGAILIGADLTKANLSEANLSETKINIAKLNKANLSEANLIEANLTGADLNGADLNGAILITANLISAKLNNVILTGASLYETLRDKWEINNIICKYVYWDDARKIKTEYKPGEFERLYSSNTIIIEYPDGIEEYQYHAFPYIIESLNTKFNGKCILTLTTIKKGAGSNSIEVNVTDIKEGYKSEEIKKMVRNAYKKKEKELKEKNKKLSIINNELRGLISNNMGKNKVDINIKGNGANIALQMDTENSKQQLKSEIDIDFDKITEFISQLKNQLKELEVSQKKKKEIDSKIETIEEELQSPKPKKKVIKECFKTIRTVLEGAAGKMVADGLITQLHQIIPNIFR